MISLNTTDIGTKLEEADLYSKHGLKLEAHKMYRVILEAVKNIAPSLRLEIEQS